MAESKSIADLVAELAKAQEEYDIAEAEESRASSLKTNATNALNRAQKALDGAMADLRSKAPWNTDWHQQRRGGGVAEIG